MNKPIPLSRRAAPRGAGGFAMLEALVGILIFSIGILGLVGVQVSMTKAQTVAKFRADAAELASELVGAMWSDLPRIPNYDSTSCRGYAPCKAWSDKVAAKLPQGTPTVAVNNGIVTITITWIMPNEAVPARFVTATAIRS